MASLVRTEPAPEKGSSEQQREPPKPPDPPQTTSEPPKNDVQSGSSSLQANGSNSAPAQPPQHPSYPYGYPPSAYPHSPYYPPPPNYPYLPHPGYGYPPPGYAPSYPSHPHPPSHPSHLHPQQPTPAPSYVPGQIEGHVVTPDDLPSYEEMIVEALMDSNDPEGWMPKQLFAWMASHYPIQSNFRPSASQALQKAFKRGRLEKSSDGKYRLSATWEGGNVSSLPMYLTASVHIESSLFSDIASYDKAPTNSKYQRRTRHSTAIVSFHPCTSRPPPSIIEFASTIHPRSVSTTTGPPSSTSAPTSAHI